MVVVVRAHLRGIQRRVVTLVVRVCAELEQLVVVRREGLVAGWRRPVKFFHVRAVVIRTVVSLDPAHSFDRVEAWRQVDHGHGGAGAVDLVDHDG